MTDPSRDLPAEPSTETAEAEHPGLPRWVWVTGLFVAVLVLAVIAAMLLLGGEHGPGRHAR